MSNKIINVSLRSYLTCLHCFHPLFTSQFVLCLSKSLVSKINFRMISFFDSLAQFYEQIKKTSPLCWIQRHFYHISANFFNILYMKIECYLNSFFEKCRLNIHFLHNLSICKTLEYNCTFQVMIDRSIVNVRMKKNKK